MRVRVDRAALALQDSEQRFHALLEVMDEGFCEIEVIRDGKGRTVDYRFVETNPAFCRHTGLVDPVGRTMLEMVPTHDTHWFDTYGRVADSGDPARFTSEARAMGRWFDVHAIRIGGAGSPRLAVRVSDITLQKQADEDLCRIADRLAQADQHKDEFIATLAHELRNPLAPLRNGLQIMRIAAGNPEAVEKARSMMERQLCSLVRLVNDLLDVASINSGKLAIRKEYVPLHSVLARAIETSAPLIEAGHHEVHLDTGATQDLLVEVDPTRMAQAISNLLNNAAKYTPPGSTIHLDTRVSDDRVVIVVKDNGIGMSSEALTSVFGMFAQARPGGDSAQGGLGIGLTLVRRLVELHGGTVVADSAGPGCGSRLTVTLPLPERAGSTGPAPSAVAPAPGTGLQVLIADDNRDAAESLAVLLQVAGHATRVVYDGPSALASVQEFVPDVAFLDIGMPGLDGYEVARRLRRAAATRGMLLVALTGRGTWQDRSIALQAGFDLHLTKPSEPRDVEAVLTKIAASREDPAQQLRSSV